MKAVIFALFVVLAVSNAHIITSDEYIDTLRGVLAGIVPEGKIENITPCLDETKLHAKLLEEGIDYLMMKDEAS